MSAPFKATTKGFILLVKATPNARHDAVEDWVQGASGAELIVKVTSPPENGKANAAVIALLAKSCGVAKSCFELVSGESNRHKQFRIISRADDIAKWLMDNKKNCA